MKVRYQKEEQLISEGTFQNDPNSNHHLLPYLESIFQIKCSSNTQNCIWLIFGGLILYGTQISNYNYNLKSYLCIDKSYTIVMLKRGAFILRTKLLE